MAFGVKTKFLMKNIFYVTIGSHMELETLFKALSDPTRRRILDLLREKPHITNELAAQFPELSRYAVMKHLNVLEEAGLISIRRDGRERWNHLNAIPLQAIYERWLKPYEAHWVQSLTNLKQLAESQPKMQAVSYEVAQEIFINADVESTYQHLLDVNGWWSHRYARFPDSLRLEPIVGGRMWEALSNDGEDGILWGIVQSIQRNDHITLSGPLGMQGAVFGVVTICTEEKEGGTLVTLDHKFMGNVPEAYTKGWGDGWHRNLNHLKTLVETGKRVELA